MAKKEKMKGKPVKPVTAKRVESSKLFDIRGGEFQFTKFNYMLMVLGGVVMIIGYLLMVGGATEDPNVFDPNEVYSFRRVTLAPTVVMIGFFIELLAILMKDPKSK